MRSRNESKVNKYIGTLHLDRTQFEHLPSSHRKTGFLRNHPLSLDIFMVILLYIKNVRDIHYIREIERDMIKQIDS